MFKKEAKDLKEGEVIRLLGNTPIVYSGFGGNVRAFLREGTRAIVTEDVKDHAFARVNLKVDHGPVFYLLNVILGDFVYVGAEKK